MTGGGKPGVFGGLMKGLADCWPNVPTYMEGMLGFVDKDLSRVKGQRQIVYTRTL